MYRPKVGDRVIARCAHHVTTGRRSIIGPVVEVTDTDCRIITNPGTDISGDFRLDFASYRFTLIKEIGNGVAECREAAAILDALQARLGDDWIAEPGAVRRNGVIIAAIEMRHARRELTFTPASGAGWMVYRALCQIRGTHNWKIWWVERQEI